MIVKCPWCGETYTFGVVGTQQIGTGHQCKVTRSCEAEGCDKRGRFQVQGHGEMPFACGEHTEGRLILGSQPLAAGQQEGDPQ